MGGWFYFQLLTYNQMKIQFLLLAGSLHIFGLEAFERCYIDMGH